MSNVKPYTQLIKDIKQHIIQSRYQAARLANRESLLLYYKTGKMLFEKITKEKWGAKVLEQIANDLQIQLPGLRGFSATNLKNMRQFYHEYSKTAISLSLTGQLTKTELNDSFFFYQLYTSYAVAQQV